MNLMPVLLAGTGGAIGALLRYLVSGLYPVYRDIPTGTLLVNFTGSLILSMITFGPNPWPHFADAGLLGGFTTFSTFSYESFCFLERKEFRVFWVNILLSLLFCGAGVVLGKLMV
ncbi:MAG: CrcB family protein [Candidatus Methanoperedens sp.]|nr:CrcB family protein [Candidatus Methanoperedens sp.]